MGSVSGNNKLFLGFLEITAQTFLYGAFTMIMPMATKTLLARGWQGIRRGPNAVLFWITLTAFLLSTGYLVGSLAAFWAKLEGEPGRFSSVRTTYNAVMLINFIFADGVVVWRMHMLCRSHFSRKLLFIPWLLLGILSVSVMMTIALRIVSTASQRPTGLLFTTVQTCANSLSLATNLVATAMFCIWMYQQRRLASKNLSNPINRTNTRVERIMMLLAESGVVYCISSAILVITEAIHTPVGGTVGDIYSPMHVQLAGMYPAFVIILVNSGGGAGTSSSHDDYNEAAFEDTTRLTSFIGSPVT